MTLKISDDWPSTRYDSRINNIVTEFFIPALRNSTTYRRIGGLFSSTSLALAARGVKELIENEGKMQLIVSPVLTEQDATVLNTCSADKRDEIIHRSFMNKLDLENEFEKNHVAALGYLLKKKALEIKIDLQTDTQGNIMDYDDMVRNTMLDEKVGIFQDREGNAISFRGPVNENKQSWERGIFSITVDVDWVAGQKLHVLDDIRRFEKMWNNSDMLSLPHKTRVALVKGAPVNLNLEKFNVPEWAMLPDGNLLWTHQIRAINLWLNSRCRGIFSIATGGGKTLAALVSASLAPIESIVLILVPTKVLAMQWEQEIRQFDPNADLVICDSDHPNWNTVLAGKLGAYVTGNDVRRDQHFLVLTVMKTAVTPKFMNNFEHIPSKFITIIADEVHHLGASNYSKIFGINAHRRLGLSATFERDWDEAGTEKITEYFGRPFEEYTIRDGIRERKLSEYEYHPFFAYLSASEFSEYVDYTTKIGIAYAMLKSTKDQAKKVSLESKVNRLRILRSEIVKKAEDKARTYEEILRACPKKPYVVFVDDRIQMAKIREAHKKTIRILNRENLNIFEKDDVMVFDGQRDKLEREKILDESLQHQTPIFAMYCLDEGVDVPELQSAIVLPNPSMAIHTKARQNSPSQQ